MCIGQPGDGASGISTTKEQIKTATDEAEAEIEIQHPIKKTITSVRGIVDSVFFAGKQEDCNAYFEFSLKEIEGIKDAPQKICGFPLCQETLKKYPDIDKLSKDYANLECIFQSKLVEDFLEDPLQSSFVTKFKVGHKWCYHLWTFTDSKEIALQQLEIVGKSAIETETAY